MLSSSRLLYKSQDVHLLVDAKEGGAAVRLRGRGRLRKAHARAAGDEQSETSSPRTGPGSVTHHFCDIWCLLVYP